MKFWSQKKASIFSIFLFLILFSIFPLMSLGQGNTPAPCDTSGKICNPLNSNIDTVQGFIQELLEGIVKILLPVVALAIIYSGFLFVAALGNKEKITKAKQTLLYTIIGAAILLGSWALAKLISETVTNLG